MSDYIEVTNENPENILRNPEHIQVVAFQKLQQADNLPSQEPEVLPPPRIITAHLLSGTDWRGYDAVVIQ